VVNPRHVTFAVTEALGLHPNGGIATATTYLAAALAHVGHRVDIVYAGWDDQVDDRWAAFYRRHGIEIHHIGRRDPVSPWWLADGYRTLTMLDRLAPDVAVVQDWQGLGGLAVTARRAGLALQKTAIVHFCHGPTAWLREANGKLDVDIAEWALGVLERRSALHADAIVGPSRYLVDWMVRNGWELTADRATIPYITQGHLNGLLGEPTPTSPPPAPVRELVFFGRLEERKGIELFLAALERLDPALLVGRSVTFLGRESTYTKERILAGMARGVLAASEVRFVDRLDQIRAREYLRRPGVVAIVPSLTDNSPNVIYECIDDGIPLLTTDAGGGPELIHVDDQSRCLFAPNANSFAQRLTEVLSAPVTPPPLRPAYDARQSLQAWNALLERVTQRHPIASQHDVPKVAVIVPYHDQPELIVDTIRSVDAQDHPNLEIVIVDDGSSPANAAVVDELAVAPTVHPIRVVHQANAYLGAARNAGMRATDAELVAFVDDDDVLEAAFVSTLVAAQRLTGATVVTTGMRTFSTEEGPPRLADEMGRWLFLGSDAVELGSAVNVFGGASALADRAALVALGGFHEQRGLGFEDWQLWARVALAGHEVLSLPTTPYWYRIRRRSMRRTMSDVRSAQVVFDAYDAELPAPLRAMSRLMRGQANAADERGWRLQQFRELEAEVDRRARYQAFLELLLEGIEDVDAAARAETALRYTFDHRRSSATHVDQLLGLMRQAFGLNPLAKSEDRIRDHALRSPDLFSTTTEPGPESSHEPS
jgi:O-antigen biosynthesis protein